VFSRLVVTNDNAAVVHRRRTWVDETTQFIHGQIRTTQIQKYSVQNNAETITATADYLSVNQTILLQALVRG
jgi:hypothetical protein